MRFSFIEICTPRNWPLISSDTFLSEHLYLSKMVATYTIFGQKVGSHIVRQTPTPPPPYSYCDTLRPSHKRCPQTSCLREGIYLKQSSRYLEKSAEPFTLTSTVTVGHGHPRNPFRRLIHWLKWW